MLKRLATSLFLVATVAACTAPSVTPSIGGLTIEPDSVTLAIGESAQLEAVFSDVIGSPDQSVSWSSDDESVATVTADGLVTAQAEGSAAIRATSVFDSSLSATATVTVEPEPSIGGLAIEPESAMVIVGGTVQLEAVFSGVVGEPDLGVTWSSDAEAVATVDEDGLVTTHTLGTATIMAVSDFDTDVSATAEVTVVPEPELGGIAIEPAEADMGVGATLQLEIVPSGVVGFPDLTATWSSDDETVATVDDEGLVTAHAVGTATITAVSNFDDSLDATAEITVHLALVGDDYAPSASVIGDAVGPLAADVSDGVPPYTFALTDGDLPEGVDLDTTTGEISGVATELGVFEGTVTVTDDIGQQVGLGYSITVVDELSVSETLIYTGDAGTPIDPLTIEVTGGLAPFSFEVTPDPGHPDPNGPLAPGLTLSEDGVISGTPTVAGFHRTFITTTDALGQFDVTMVEIDVLLVLMYSGSPYTYPLGCGGSGAGPECPDGSEGGDPSFSAIVPIGDIEVIGLLGDLTFSWTPLHALSDDYWDIDTVTGVIYRSDAGGAENDDEQHNADRSYEVEVFDDGTTETATFVVEFLVDLGD
jgi:uncharacterized protein YjdB